MSKSKTFPTLEQCKRIYELIGDNYHPSHIEEYHWNGNPDRDNFRLQPYYWALASHVYPINGTSYRAYDIEELGKLIEDMYDDSIGKPEQSMPYPFRLITFEYKGCWTFHKEDEEICYEYENEVQARAALFIHLLERYGKHFRYS